MRSTTSCRRRRPWRAPRPASSDSDSSDAPPLSAASSGSSPVPPPSTSTMHDHTDQDHEGDGQQGPLLRHGAVTQPTPDRFPSSVRCGQGLCHAVDVPEASRRPRRSPSSAAASPASRRPTGSAQGLPEADVVVLEASPRIGGSLRTAEVGGVVVDVGRRGDAQPATRGRRASPARSGLGDDLVHPATISAHLWNRGRLVPMPRTLMGVPLDLRALDGVISAEGRRPRRDGRRAAADRARRCATSASATSSRSGSARRSSTGWWSPCSAACTPATPARSPPGPPCPSWWRCSTATGRSPGPRRQPCRRPTEDARAGVRRASAGEWAGCPSALARACGATVRTGRDGARPRPRVPAAAGTSSSARRATPSCVQADAVVLATPARPPPGCSATWRPPRAAPGPHRVRLDGDRHAGRSRPARSPRSPAPGSWCRRWTAARSRPRPSPSPSGTGCAQPGRVGRGRLLLLRCSLGRHREEQTLQRTDEELVELAAGRPRRRASGLPVPPVDAHVQRWGGALPQYAVGHLDRVATVRASWTSLPGLAVCGSAYDGVGIPACIASAELAAAKVVRGPCHNGAMTRDRTGRRQEGTRAQRHHPLHDVVGVPPARRARRATPTATPRPARSRSWSRKLEADDVVVRGSTTSAACAPTPT